MNKKIWAGIYALCLFGVCASILYMKLMTLFVIISMYVLIFFIFWEIIYMMLGGDEE